MSGTAPVTMTWWEARALLEGGPGVEISSLHWEQAGKCIFKARATLRAGGASELVTEPMLWFLTKDGRVHEYRGSTTGEARADWIVGRSPGKPSA